MSVPDIISMISSVGFPIVACIFLGYYIMKRVDKMGEVVDNNTKAIMLLVNELNRGDKE